MRVNFGLRKGELLTCFDPGWVELTRVQHPHSDRRCAYVRKSTTTVATWLTGIRLAIRPHNEGTCDMVPCHIHQHYLAKYIRDYLLATVPDRKWSTSQVRTLVRRLRFAPKVPHDSEFARHPRRRNDLRGRFYSRVYAGRTAANAKTPVRILYFP